MNFGGGRRIFAYGQPVDMRKGFTTNFWGQSCVHFTSAGRVETSLTFQWRSPKAVPIRVASLRPFPDIWPMAAIASRAPPDRATFTFWQHRVHVPATAW